MDGKYPCLCDDDIDYVSGNIPFQALEDFDHVIKLQPNNAHAIFRRAFIYKVLLDACGFDHKSIGGCSYAVLRMIRCLCT